LGKTAVVAITKHGIEIARRIKSKMPDIEIYVPAKHSDGGTDVNWFSEQSSHLIASLFKSHEALICIFSLGAIIRMVAPYLADKKSDPAVIAIDDRANYVISVLSGHIGGANALTKLVASFLGATPVITTAADVNQTIAVDLIGKEFDWIIENFDNVTKTSAHMVNEEKIAFFQDAGERNWWKGPLPRNVSVVNDINEVLLPDFKAAIVITDRIVNETIMAKSVVYRPKTLVVGIGLHWDTSKETIESGVSAVFKENQLALKSIRNIASVDRGARVKGLDEFAREYGVPVNVYKKEDLARVEVPNPSIAVQRFEGTASVSEAAAILSSNDELIVQKQKFPPNLTIAVCRVTSKALS
jgi:cobalt-precorrin 5A hydrolase